MDYNDPDQYVAPPTESFLDQRERAVRAALFGVEPVDLTLMPGLEALEEELGRQKERLKATTYRRSIVPGEPAKTS